MYGYLQEAYGYPRAVGGVGESSTSAYFHPGSPFLTRRCHGPRGCQNNQNGCGQMNISGDAGFHTQTMRAVNGRPGIVEHRGLLLCRSSFVIILSCNLV